MATFLYGRLGNDSGAASKVKCGHDASFRRQGGRRYGCIRYLRGHGRYWKLQISYLFEGLSLCVRAPGMPTRTAIAPTRRR
jgi:hypothetical protein